MPRVDQQRRLEVKAVVDGSQQHVDHYKTAFYGILVGLFQDADLKSFNLSSDKDSLYSLKVEMGNKLKRLVWDALDRWDPPQKPPLYIVSSGRTHHYTEPSQNRSHTKERLERGVNTATTAEIATLGTIARLQTEGATISRAGLYKSKRVPFAYAMSHVSGLADMKTKLSYWDEPVGTAVRVFQPEHVTLSYDNGLSLVSPPQPRERDESAEALYGPAIGCPVTFLQGTFEAIHRIAADAAVDSGLIEIS